MRSRKCINQNQSTFGNGNSFWVYTAWQFDLTIEISRTHAPQQIFSTKRFVAMSRLNRKGKEEKVMLDVSGVHLEWDAADDIRGRMREGETLIHPEGKRDDVQGCCRNSSILIPLLTRMATVEGKPLPPVDPLRLEIDQLLIKNKKKCSRRNS